MSWSLFLKSPSRLALLAIGILAASGCSVFGKSGVEVAPYEILRSDNAFEVRRYERMVLVSTPMDDLGDDRSGAFNRLFGYISGDNISASRIDMTAPVFMDPASRTGQEIAMTAPVLTDGDSSLGSRRMAFVLPASFDYDTAPRPTNPDVELSEVTDLTVATITFSGTLSESNISSNRASLERWIGQNGYEITGPHQSAGYNPPWTLPNLRRNEVLIPIRFPG